MSNDRMGQLSGLALPHDGVFTRADAAAIGVDRRRLNRAVTAGVLRQVHPQVFQFVAAPRTPRSAVRAAVWQVRGSHASHESALLLRGVERIPFSLAVTVPFGGNHDHHGIRVHRAADLLEAHLDVVDGIATTTLERAVVDVATVFGPSRLDALIDHVTITRRMTSVGAISRTLRQVNRRGRIHIARLAPLLDARRPGEPAPRSRLERTVDELLAPSTLPRPSAEYPLPTSGRFQGFVDRAWPDAMLIVEVDGRSWHAREASMARDRARDREAGRHGWHTLRVLDEEVSACATDVLADITATHAVRLRQLRASA